MSSRVSSCLAMTVRCWSSSVTRLQRHGPCNTGSLLTVQDACAACVARQHTTLYKLPNPCLQAQLRGCTVTLKYYSISSQAPGLHVLHVLVART
jgi:hypothetical protein